jgi:hypothetical protein
MKPTRLIALVVLAGALSLVIRPAAFVHADPIIDQIQAEFEHELRAVSAEMDSLRSEIILTEGNFESILNGVEDNLYADLSRVCELPCYPERGACSEEVFRDAFVLRPDEELRFEERRLTTGLSTCGIIGRTFTDLSELPKSCATVVQKCKKAREARVAGVGEKIKQMKAQITKLSQQKLDLIKRFGDTLKRLGYKPERPFLEGAGNMDPNSQLCSWLYMGLPGLMNGGGGNWNGNSGSSQNSGQNSGQNSPSSGSAAPQKPAPVLGPVFPQLEN